MAFTRFALDELEPGVLYDAFTSGTSAALVECDDLLQKLWSMLLLDPEEKLPWELPLVDIARNHVRGKDLPSTLGDVFYFQPGHHSYIGRKLEITPSDPPSVIPAKFHQEGNVIAPKEELVNLCCSFVDRIMRSISSPQKPIPDYKVAVQRLKYQAEWEDYEALTALIEDSLARWGRKGFTLDVLQGQVSPPFARKGVSDLMALLMMARGSGLPSKKPGGNRDIDESGDCETRIYEHSHVDFRYFTALCGQRQNVLTQVFVGGKWHELPVNLDTIAIYPGTMCLEGTSLSPTVHRVVHRSSPPMPGDRGSNVTVLLGAV